MKNSESKNNVVEKEEGISYYAHCSAIVLLLVAIFQALGLFTYEDATSSIHQVFFMLKGFTAVTAFGFSSILFTIKTR